VLGWRDANGSRVAGRFFSSDDLEGMQGAMDSFLLAMDSFISKQRPRFAAFASCGAGATLDRAEQAQLRASTSPSH
jgi:hypothetical protein